MDEDISTRHNAYTEPVTRGTAICNPSGDTLGVVEDVLFNIDGAPRGLLMRADDGSLHALSLRSVCSHEHSSSLFVEATTATFTAASPLAASRREDVRQLWDRQPPASLGFTEYFFNEEQHTPFAEPGTPQIIEEPSRRSWYPGSSSRIQDEPRSGGTMRDLPLEQASTTR